MLTFDLTPLARRFECLPALEAARGKDLSRVGWLFLSAMLREMPIPDAETKAVVDPVIAGMDRLASGEDWPEEESAERSAALAALAAPAARKARAAAAAEAAYAAQAARRAGRDVSVPSERDNGAAPLTATAALAAALAALAAALAPRAAEWAEQAGVPVERQREILMRLIEEAPDADV